MKARCLTKSSSESSENDCDSTYSDSSAAVTDQEQVRSEKECNCNSSIVEKLVYLHTYFAVTNRWAKHSVKDDRYQTLT